MFKGESWTKLMVMVAASGLLLAAGCGGDDDDDDGDDDNGADVMVDSGMEDVAVDSGMDAGEDVEEDTDEMDDVEEDTMDDVEEDTNDFACTYFPDSCEEGQNCFWNPNGNRECGEYEDSVAIGESCSSATACSDNARCVGEVCRALCDPDNLEEWGCGEEDICSRAATEDGTEAPWGYCQPAEECEVGATDECPENTNCYAVTFGGGQQGTQCLEYNPDAQVGATCEQPTDCGDNQWCAVPADADEGSCVNKCDPEATDNVCAEGETCETGGNIPFGLCTPSE